MRKFYPSSLLGGLVLILLLWPGNNSYAQLPSCNLHFQDYQSQYNPQTMNNPVSVMELVDLPSVVATQTGSNRSYWVVHPQGLKIKFQSGKAILEGRIWNVYDTGQRLRVTIKLKNKKNWTQWSGMGRTYSPSSAPASYYTNWEYWEFESGTLKGEDQLSGTLTLSAQPSNNNTGFQMGDNAHDGFAPSSSIMPGISGTFGISGRLNNTHAGSGASGSLASPLACCDNVTGGGQIGPAASYCGFTDPPAIQNLATPPGGSGPLEYMWLSSTSGCPNNATQAIPGATDSIYDPDTLYQTTWFVRCSRRVGCSDWTKGESNCVKITIKCCQLNDGGTIGNDETNCGPFDPQPITTVTPVSGGAGVVEYMWLSSTQGCPNRANQAIPGATDSVYDPGMITQTTWYVRCSRRSACSSWTQGESNCVKKEVLPQPIVSTTSSDVDCFGNNSGSASASGSGGKAPYSFSWSTGDSTASVSMLTAGTYFVTLTDDNGCTDVDTVVISEPAQLTATLNATNVSCFGFNDGSINSTVTGGTMPYAFSWSNGSTMANLSNLAPGTYSVTITDVNNCSTTASATITEPAAPISLNSTNVTCNGFMDGSITATGGTAPYTYSLTALKTVDQQINANTDDVFEDSTGGIRAGTQRIRMVFRSNFGNTAVGLRFNGLNIPQGATITSASVQFTTSATNNRNPSALTIKGQAADNAMTFSNGVANDVTGRATTSASVNWSPAAWNTVGDAGADQQTPDLSGIIQEIVNRGNWQSGNAIALIITGSGRRSAWAHNGDPELAPVLSIEYSMPVSASNTMLSGGKYIVNVTDANGCTFHDTVEILEPSLLEASASGTNVTCRGANDGSATVSAQGGTPNFFFGYSVMWSNGATTASISGLSNGTYYVTVTDDNGCTAVDSVRIRQPKRLRVQVVVTPVTCFGDSNGVAAINPTGGTAPYSAVWSTGATTNAVTGLSGGTYSVTVTDANGCTVTETFNVFEPTKLKATKSSTNVSCFGFSDGTASVTPSGGSPNFFGQYTYLWSNGATTQSISGLSAGRYRVTITDARGCTITRKVDITEPTQLTVSINVDQRVSCAGGNDGSATAVPAGGTLNFFGFYSFQWSNGQVGAQATGLSAGTYAVTVTDGNQCTATATVVITEPAPLAVNVTSTDVSCKGGNDGTASAQASGGNPDFFGGYQYAWSNGMNTPSISGLTAGTYTVTVTDNKGCTTTGVATVGEPNDFKASLDACQDTAITCGGEAILSVDLDGTGPWTFSYTDGSTIQTVTTNVSPYRIRVAPQSTTTYTLVSVTGGPNNCPGNTSGNVTVAVSGSCTAGCYTLDFELDANGSAIAAGDDITNQYAAWGVNISATGGINEAWTFNSASPTGGDPDLGTPNASFGGPGVGNGGALGQPGENAIGLGNVLIIQENNNTPDDNSRGGEITFTFNRPVDVQSLKVLDIEEAGSTIELMTVNGPSSVAIPALGDNSVQLVNVNAAGVTKMTVKLTKSGAIDEVQYCPSNCFRVDFESSAMGMNLNAGTNISRQYQSWGLRISAAGGINQAWIFDSNNPTGGDPDLGTPNASFGGPGVGNGGAAGMAGENAVAQNNVLIVQENNGVPDDNQNGGQLNFFFDEPADVKSIKVIDIDENGSYILLNTLNGQQQVNLQNLGENSVQEVALNATGVLSMVVNFRRSGGVDDLIYCLTGCTSLIFSADANGNTLPAGTNVTTQFDALGISSVTATGGINQAWVFDTNNPTGGDDDLGTPNASFGGPGVGADGALGMPGENSIPLDNILVIQENNSGIPDDNARGGDLTFNFSTPVLAQSLRMVDIEDNNSYVEVTLASGGTVQFPIAGKGDNAVQDVIINTAGVTSLTVHFAKSGGVAGLNYCQDCAELCLNSSVYNVIPGPSFTLLTVGFSCDPNCPAGANITPDAIDVSVPCGTIDTFFTTGATGTLVSSGNGSGITGIRLDNFSGCNSNGFLAEVTYKLSNIGACGGFGFCDPLVAYQLGNCTQYEQSGTPGLPSPNAQPVVDGGDFASAGQANSAISGYPNPATDLLMIKLECDECHDGPVTVYLNSLLGTTMAEITVEMKDGQGEASHNISSYNQGIYFLEADLPGQPSAYKVVKQ